MKRRAGKIAPKLFSTSRLANPEGKPRQFFKFISAAESWVRRELGGLEGLTPFQQKRLSDDFPRTGRARNWGQKHRGDTKSERAGATFGSLCKTLPIDNGRKSGRYSPQLGARGCVCFWVSLALVDSAPLLFCRTTESTSHTLSRVAPFVRSLPPRADCDSIRVSERTQQIIPRRIPVRKIKVQGLFVVATLTLCMVVVSAHAQTYSDLYNFGDASGDPLNPQYSGIIAQGRDGNLYSTTPAGGGAGLGTVFNINAQGAMSVLYNFDGAHGKFPYGGLTLGTDSNFYGTTSVGGSTNLGVIFKITPAGALTVLHTFASGDGILPTLLRFRQRTETSTEPRPSAARRAMERYTKLCRPAPILFCTPLI
jgi:uncharacterized repeat protein (TIGR03803 family)